MDEARSGVPGMNDREKHKNWREELYQKLKNCKKPIRACEMQKRCGMDVSYAMKKIMEEHKDVFKYSQGGETYYATEDYLPALPSAQPERRWIPVSERLPETPIRVQVQLDNTWIITAYYDEGEWYDVPGDGEPIDGVLAWMQLPEPWKGARAQPEHYVEDEYIKSRNCGADMRGEQDE